MVKQQIIFDIQEIIADIHLGDVTIISSDDVTLFINLGVDTALGIRTSAILLHNKYADDAIRSLVRHIASQIERMLCRHTYFDYDEETHQLLSEWEWVGDTALLIKFCVVELTTEDY